MANEIEIWRGVEGFEDYYEVSNKSRVRSLDRVIVYSNGSTRNHKGDVLKPMQPKNQYPYICIRINGSKINKYIHRLVAIAFIPNPYNKQQVNHINGIKNDNRIENLEWCTPSENGLHAYKNNLSNPLNGSKAPWSILDEEKVLAVKRLFRMNKNFHRGNTAAKLGVNINTIVSIIKNRNWNYLNS